MVKALIRMGDMTTHGGKVLEGFSDYTIQGIPVAGVGHKTICPLCKGVFPIIQGYGGITVNGVWVALDGYVTACGAKLIASQMEEVVDDGGGASVGYVTLSDEQTDQKSMIDDGVYRPNQDKGEVAQIAAEDEEFRSENDPVRRELERNDPNSDLNLGLREQFDRINRANKELNKPFYSEMRSPDDPYTKDDIGRLSRKADNLEDEVRFVNSTPTEIVDKIIGMFDFSDDYYKSSSTRFIQLLVSLMQEVNIAITLHNIVDYSSLTNFNLTKEEASKNIKTDFSLDDNDIFKMSEAKETAQKPINDNAMTMYRRLKEMDKKSYSGFLNRLSVLVEGDLKNIFKETEFNIDYAIANGEQLFLAWTV